MGRKVWVLFTAIGNPHVYTIHGVFDQPGRLEAAKKAVSDGGYVLVKELELNDKVEERM